MARLTELVVGHCYLPNKASVNNDVYGDDNRDSRASVDNDESEVCE